MAILSLVKCNDIDSSVQDCSNSIANALGADSIQRCHLTRIGNSIVEIRRSNDRLISTNGFPTLVRWYLYIESGPWSYCSLVLNHLCDSFTRFSHLKHIFFFFFIVHRFPPERYIRWFRIRPGGCVGTDSLLRTGYVFRTNLAGKLTWEWIRWWFI